jgi:hypothetical protein
MSRAWRLPESVRRARPQLPQQLTEEHGVVSLHRNSDIPCRDGRRPASRKLVASGGRPWVFLLAAARIAAKNSGDTASSVPGWSTDPGIAADGVIEMPEAWGPYHCEIPTAPGRIGLIPV